MRIGTLLLCVLFAAPASSRPLDDFSLSARIRDLANYYPTYLANGYWSLASTARGTDPAASQIAAIMDYSPGDVSRPAAIPSWNEIDYYDGAHWLNAAPVTPASHARYGQILDMYDGVLTTRYRWNDGEHGSDILASAFVSQAAPHLAAVSLALTPQFSGEIRVRFTLRPLPAPTRYRLAEMSADQFSAAAAQANAADAARGGKRNAIWYPGHVDIDSIDADIASRTLTVEATAVGGQRVAIAAAIAYPSDLNLLRIERAPADALLDGAIALDVVARAERGHRYVFTKFVAASAAGWSEISGDARAQAARARAAGADVLRAAHVQAWHELWRSDVRVSGNAELQRTIHSDLFYLLENSSLDGNHPAAACGFSANYFGHVFWDDDLWVFPALLLLHPERARSLLAFRSEFLPQAAARAKAHGLAGAMYPWEADPASGADVTPAFAVENADREIHVNGAVALAQWQYYLASGDRAWLQRTGYPVMAAVADFWVSRVSWDASRQRYELRDVTSPEEDYVHVNNEIYTNIVARQSLLAAAAAAHLLQVAPGVRWAEVAARLYLPTAADHGVYHDFDPSTPHDKTTSWMATSVPMLSIPAVGFGADADTMQGLFQHSAAAIAGIRGRANQMVLVMQAIQAANIGDAAYFSEMLGGDGRPRDPFLKPPFNVRSETPQNDSTYLLASSGGFIQAFIYGLSGLRLTESGLTESFPPNLPRELASLELAGLHVRGAIADVLISRDSRGSIVRKLSFNSQPRTSAPVKRF
jgi:protein-glucosylgalactosylhydroxylysine glucosidase